MASHLAFESTSVRASIRTSSPLLARIAPSLAPVETEFLPAERWAQLAPSLDDLGARPNVFFSFPFAGPAFTHVARRKGLGAVVVRAGAMVIGFFPGRVEMTSLFRGWTHPYAPDGTPLMRQGFEAQALEGFFAHARDAGWRTVLFPLIDTDDTLPRLSRFATSSYRLTATLDAHERACLVPGDRTALKGPRVRELDRLGRRLSEAGTLTRVSTALGWSMDAAVDAFVALEAAGWKGKAGTAFRSNPSSEAFFRDLAAGLEGNIRIDALMLDSEPVAIGVVLLSGDRAWYWKTTYCEAHARFSPGAQITLALTRDLLADPHLTLVDSCAVPDHPMVDKLWRARMGVADIMIAVSPKGPGFAFRWHVAAEKGRRRLRSEAKRLYHRLRGGRGEGGE